MASNKATVDVTASKNTDSVANSETSNQTKQSDSNSLREALLNMNKQPANVTRSPTSDPANPSRASTSPSSSSPNLQKYCPNSTDNPLGKYASVNYLFTMACLTFGQFNTASYRDAPYFDNTIFSSAGRFDNQRVDTTHGQPEYYIDNLPAVH